MPTAVASADRPDQIVIKIVLGAEAAACPGSRPADEPPAPTRPGPPAARRPSRRRRGRMRTGRSSRRSVGPRRPGDPVCRSDGIGIERKTSAMSEGMCPEHATEIDETARARAYLIETATPGYTMTRQGPERAIGRLHPEFVRRLAAAIAEARAAGLPFTRLFSAYRPPAFGIGGFADKFHSLHTYGLAVDVTGIGAPGTPSALLWHEIAARNGVICPYGPHNPVEWNHCQPTWVKIILPDNPLRETVTADGPVSLEGMFEVGLFANRDFGYLRRVHR